MHRAHAQIERGGDAGLAKLAPGVLVRRLGAGGLGGKACAPHRDQGKRVLQLLHPAPGQQRCAVLFVQPRLRCRALSDQFAHPGEVCFGQRQAVCLDRKKAGGIALLDSDLVVFRAQCGQVGLDLLQGRFIAAGVDPQHLRPRADEVAGFKLGVAEGDRARDLGDRLPASRRAHGAEAAHNRAHRLPGHHEGACRDRPFGLRQAFGRLGARGQPDCGGDACGQRWKDTQEPCRFHGGPFSPVRSRRHPAPSGAQSMVVRAQTTVQA